MKQKKGFKYYLTFYGIITGVYFIYISILAIQNGGYDATLLFSVVYLPILFIAFIVLFDGIFDKLFNRKKPNQNDDFTNYNKIITAHVNEQCNLTIEDFRHLREDMRFQKGLFQAYTIKNNGETKEMNFIVLEKKFKKKTKEYEAMSVVINETKKMMENS